MGVTGARGLLNWRMISELVRQLKIDRINMKRIFIVLLLSVAISGMPNQKAEASIPILAIIKEAIEKVIKAVDLMVQRLQNKTIWLQNAQKVLENKLNELKLTEIAEWTEKHRKLYKEYYDELWKVRHTASELMRLRRDRFKPICWTGLSEMKPARRNFSPPCR